MMGERGGKQEEKRRRVTWLEVENNVELTSGGSVMMGERGAKQDEKRRRVTWLEVENNVELTWGVGAFGGVMVGGRGGEKCRVT